MPYATSVSASFALKHLVHCIMLHLAYMCSYTLYHVEPKLEESMEQAQVEDFTNLDLDQDKLWCI
jgi:hypothetical protein